MPLPPLITNNKRQKHIRRHPPMLARDSAQIKWVLRCNCFEPWAVSPMAKVEKYVAKAVFCQLTDQTVFSYEVVHINLKKREENMIKLVDHKSKNDNKMK
jgi:hypothetical protein